jgi:hypothetical protein
VLGEVAAALGAPVLTSYGGRGLLPPDHPCALALPPHEPAVGALWDAADLVLCVGSDLDAMNTQGFRQPQPPRLVTVDLVEPVNYPPDVWVRADARQAMEVLLEALPSRPRPPWWRDAGDRAHLAGLETQLLDAIESALPDDAVVVADMCKAGYWYGGYGRVARPRGLAYPVGWGTLGFGFPASLGAALSGRPTVALVGDVLHHPRALVAEDRRRVPRGVGAAGGVHVGVADAARREPHEDLAGTWPVELDLLHLERLAELLQHRSADPHARTLVHAPRVGERQAEACNAACSSALGNAHAARVRRSWRKWNRSWLGGRSPSGVSGRNVAHGSERSRAHRRLQRK